MTSHDLWGSLSETSGQRGSGERTTQEDGKSETWKRERRPAVMSRVSSKDGQRVWNGRIHMLCVVARNGRVCVPSHTGEIECPVCGFDC